MTELAMQMLRHIVTLYDKLEQRFQSLLHSSSANEMAFETDQPKA